MNTPIEISVLADYISQIEDIIHPEKNYLYRCQENEEWKVNSSAYRRLESSASPAEKRYERFSDLLRYQYRGYLLQIIDEIQLKYPATYRNQYPLECMAHLQHNKVATGLIDFTFSPLASLWFACANKDINGKVIVLEPILRTCFATF